jgi:RHS repeat-associated protein
MSTRSLKRTCPRRFSMTRQVQDVIADGQNGDIVHNYLYDAEGRVCAVQFPASMTGLPNQMIQYLYDAEGKRIGKGTITQWSCNIDLPNGFQLTNEYVLGQGGEQVTEFDGNGNWLHTNAYAGGLLIATYDTANSHTYANPALHYQIADWLGTRRVQVSPAGALEETCQSLPFGDQLNCVQTNIATSDDATEHHFTGKERDTESGLDYFGARYYASNMGRWMSPDWAAKISPVPYAKLDDPQSLNLYSYVRNNPLSRMDPDGHYDCNGNECKMVKNALKDINKASNSKNLTDDQRSALKGIVSFYGKAGDHNGVTVNTGDAAVGANGGTHTDANGQTTISLKLSNWDSKGLSDSSARTEKDATVAHEGEHGVQQQDHGMPHSAASEYLGELQAYSVQSSINEARGVSSAYGTWTTGGGFNEGKIQSYADKSTNMFCGGCWTPIREGAPPQ